VNIKNIVKLGIIVLACFTVFFVGYFIGQANLKDVELRVENARMMEMMSIIRDIDAERKYGKEYPGIDARGLLEYRLVQTIISTGPVLSQSKDEEARRETCITLWEVVPYKEEFLLHLQDSKKIEEIKLILSLAEKELIKMGV
jgi:hypothetical protein